MIFEVTRYPYYETKQFTLRELAAYFDLPLLSAAAHLGVSETYLKRQCRLLSIRRWPHRKIQALLTQKRQMELQCPYVSAKMLERWQKKTEELGARIEYLREYGHDKELYIPRKMRLSKRKMVNLQGAQPESEIGSIVQNSYPSDNYTTNGYFNIEQQYCTPDSPLGFHLKLDIGSLMNDPYIKIVF